MVLQGLQADFAVHGRLGARGAPRRGRVRRARGAPARPRKVGLRVIATRLAQAGAWTNGAAEAIGGACIPLGGPSLRFPHGRGDRRQEGVTAGRCANRQRQWLRSRLRAAARAPCKALSLLQDRRRAAALRAKATRPLAQESRRPPRGAARLAVRCKGSRRGRCWGTTAGRRPCGVPVTGRQGGARGLWMNGWVGAGKALSQRRPCEPPATSCLLQPAATLCSCFCFCCCCSRGSRAAAAAVAIAVNDSCSPPRTLLRAAAAPAAPRGAGSCIEAERLEPRRPGSRLEAAPWARKARARAPRHSLRWQTGQVAFCLSQEVMQPV
jgi:hypothetical protein